MEGEVIFTIDIDVAEQLAAFALDHPDEAQGMDLAVKTVGGQSRLVIVKDGKEVKFDKL